MKQDLINYLPPDIITSILSSLPLRTIAISRCVCRSWRNFLNTDRFIYSHLAKSESSPSVAVIFPFQSSPPLCRCRVSQFKNQLDDFNSDYYFYNKLTKFDLPEKSAKIVGAADGLLFISEANWLWVRKADYICNPITREYVRLWGPNPRYYLPVGAYGFGASRISRQYKVVLITNPPNRCCYVYTLGKGSWRRVGVGAPRYSLNNALSSACLDGNLHWAKKNRDGPLITCFDLETERFSSFRGPTPLYGTGGLSVLSGCLCFCDWRDDGELVVWLMKEYGVEKSWSKEYVMWQSRLDLDVVYGYKCNLVYPIRVFENGDVLMLLAMKFVVYYSNKTKTCQAYCMSYYADRDLVSSVPFTPSFLSLKGLGMKNVAYF